MPTPADAPEDEKVDLYTAISSSYGDPSSGERLVKRGYRKDEALSDHRQQVWFNPTAEKDKKLLMTIAGTHTKRDYLTDAALGAGFLKHTTRYKSAHKTLRKAKEVYNLSTATVVGHSLGGSIAQGVASKGDKVFAANAGFTIGGKAKKEHTVVRMGADVISALGRNQKTLSGGPLRPYKAHGTEAFKGKKVYL